MGILKRLQKNVKSHHLLALLAVCVFAVIIQQISARKSYNVQGFGSSRSSVQSSQQSSQPTQPNPAAPAGQNEVYASASGATTTTQGLPPSCSQGATASPSELLPRDDNNEWAKLNPSGGGDFANNGNLLKAGYFTGIDTVGSSLRNPNLQVRSEPPNPTTKVSPWGNTTMEPDLMRVPLELGCGSQ